MNQPSIPWKRGYDKTIVDAEGNDVYEWGRDGGSMIMEDDIDLIVRAVNSHEKLLKWAKEYLEDKILENHTFDGRYDALIQEIEADIKEAEGEL